MGWLEKYQDGGIIEDDKGQWAHPGKITKINSNNITMKGVNYPVLGISNTGDERLMMPGEDYKFDGDSVTEYPMAQNGGRWLDKKESPQKFIQNYINSPKYRERLESSDYYNVDEEIKIRSKNLKDTKVNYSPLNSDKYDPVNNTIYVGDINDTKYNLPTGYTEAHEFTHAELDNVNLPDDITPYDEYKSSGFKNTRLNDYDNTNLRFRLKDVDNPEKVSSHTWSSGENKADLNALRYSLYKQGIYDTGKESFTEEHLKKLKDSNKSNPYEKSGERLMKNYTDKDLIWLMNNIAQNSNNNNNDDVHIAQNGIKAIKLDAVHLKGRQSPEWKAYKDSLSVYNKSKKRFNDDMVSDTDNHINSVKSLLKDMKEGPVKDYWAKNPEDVQKTEKYLQDLTKGRSKQINRLQSYYKQSPNLESAPKKSQLRPMSWTGKVGNGDGKFKEETNTWYDVMDTDRYGSLTQEQGDMMLNNSVQPTNLLGWGERGSYLIYKEPTKPQNKKVNIESKGISEFDTEMPDEYEAEFSSPYNLSGNKKNTSQRTKHRRTHLRPNGTPYPEGYHPEESLPKLKKKEKAQNGKTVELDPVYINVKETPEWRAYKDSLDIHDLQKESNKIYLDIINTAKTDEEYMKRSGIIKGDDNELTSISEKINKILRKHPDWQPINSYQPEMTTYSDGTRRKHFYLNEFKNPTKPQNKSIKPQNKAINLQAKGPNLTFAEPQSGNITNRFIEETVPYNLTDEVISKDDEGNQYIKHNGKVKRKQTREEYRKTNLRPNGKEFKNGGWLDKYNK